jgi:DUF2892 family protein
VIAVGIAALYFTGHIDGTLAMVLGIVAVVSVTSSLGWCPGYLPLGLRTGKEPSGHLRREQWRGVRRSLHGSEGLALSNLSRYVLLKHVRPLAYPFSWSTLLVSRTALLPLN